MTDLHEGEIFTFFHYRFDIDLVRAHIAAGDIPFTKQKMNIVPWAEQMLSLKRDQPDRKPVSLMMRIDYKFLDNISDERLNEPIFVAQTKDGAIIIDGNHRVAKAYMKGINELDAIVFDERASKLLNKPVKTPKMKTFSEAPARETSRFMEVSENVTEKYRMNLGNADGRSNLKLIFRDGKLVSAEVL